MTNAKAPLPETSDGIDQGQFLTILSREEAIARFEAALFPRAVAGERRKLAEALGCALAEDVTAPIDVPPFDRSNVDGFAVRSADLAAAGEGAPVRLLLNDAVIACGDLNVLPGSVTFLELGALGLADLVTGRGHTDTRTSHYRKAPRWADYLLVNGKVRVDGFSVPAAPEVSDHRPLVLDLTPAA